MSGEQYDSRSDTLAHIDTVRIYMAQVRDWLRARAIVHDQSKLVEPEKAIFDEYTPKLRDSTYGSNKYKEFLEGMGVGLRHHYEHNSHHPEYHSNGIDGMSLLDIVEMLCDWKAATQRHADGDIRRSVEINRDRFHISSQLACILLNTIDELGW